MWSGDSIAMYIDVVIWL